MIGFWEKSVFVTYFGAFCAICGLLYGLKTNNLDYAFVGIIIAGVADMFDGKVARKNKNRTESQKDFGVEIDSLADIICFILIPVIILYEVGLNNIYQIIILALYGICGIIRLGYYNVVMSDKNKAIEYYTGLPVPVSVIVLGTVWILSKIVGFVNANEIIIFTILVPIMGYLHISKIKVKKFTSNWYYVLIISLALFSIIFGKWILK